MKREKSTDGGEALRIAGLRWHRIRERVTVEDKMEEVRSWVDSLRKCMQRMKKKIARAV